MTDDYPDVPVREWPQEAQRRLALVAVNLFARILEALGFEPDDAAKRAEPYRNNLDNRLRDMYEENENCASQDAFVARYAPAELVGRYLDAHAPGGPVPLE